ncbi:ribosomal L7Ae/L30e/S12e/Gadd45 family protein [Candidatus Woesearchaeota archaeon]|nr:ribosomal L7Ae/L30e/S12e/Gadd45 family protein [Candidatus Woesearchaeota archaeon]
MDAISEIKKLLNDERLIIGTERTMKALRQGSLEKVYLAANPAADVKADLERYAGMGNLDKVDLDVTNDELGTLCRKPFPISIIGLRKQ